MTTSPSQIITTLLSGIPDGSLLKADGGQLSPVSQDDIVADAVGAAETYTDVAVAAHVIAADPHGDRAYADGLVAGVTPTYSAENKDAITLAPGMAVATHSSGTGIVGALAANTTKPAVGLILASTAPTFAGAVQIAGLFTLADWTAVIGAATLTRGPYYLDPTTPGRLTQSAPTTPGQIVQVVGYAVSTVALEISPSSPVLL